MSYQLLIQIEQQAHHFRFYFFGSQAKCVDKKQTAHRLKYSFTLKNWFINNGSTIMNWSNTNTYCSSQSGYTSRQQHKCQFIAIIRQQGPGAPERCGTNGAICRVNPARDSPATSTGRRSRAWATTTTAFSWAMAASTAATSTQRATCCVVRGL